MNTLSWMIYAADVANTSSALGTATFVIAAIGGAYAAALAAVDQDSANWDVKDEDERSCIKAGWNAGKGFFKVAAIAAAIIIPIPSSTTIYAIAASELGESALESETGGKAVEALNAWLDRQIGEEDATNAN